MSRPNFLTSPGVWVRASRIAQSPADYAAAVEHHQQRPSWLRIIVCLLACVAIGYMLAQGV